MKILIVLAACLALAGCFTTEEERAAKDDANCGSYGAKPGSDAYIQCRMAAAHDTAIKKAAVLSSDSGPTHCTSTGTGNSVSTNCY